MLPYSQAEEAAVRILMIKEAPTKAQLELVSEDFNRQTQCDGVDP